MSNGTHEFSGKTVDEAIEIGLNQLGLAEGDVTIEVVNRGSRGIFGLGSEAAVIRITPKSTDAPAAAPITGDHADTPLPAESTPTPASVSSEAATDGTAEETADGPAASQPSAQAESSSAPADAAAGDTGVQEDGAQEDGAQKGDDQTDDAETGPASDETSDESGAVDDEELAEMSADMLEELVSLMGFDAEVEASWHEADENGNPYLLLDIRGDDLGTLIGRRGETLASLQYLLRLMVNQRLRQWKNIVVDVEDYKQRRTKQLTGLAQRMARQVADSGRSIALEPMPANERRIIHLTLRDNPDVFTESIGEGDRRKVTIAPRHT